MALPRTQCVLVFTPMALTHFPRQIFALQAFCVDCVAEYRLSPQTLTRRYRQAHAMPAGCNGGSTRQDLLQRFQANHFLNLLKHIPSPFNKGKSTNAHFDLEEDSIPLHIIALE